MRDGIKECGTRSNGWGRGTRDGRRGIKGNRGMRQGKEAMRPRGARDKGEREAGDAG